jgi:hypothetical protein
VEFIVTAQFGAQSAHMIVHANAATKTGAKAFLVLKEYRF